MIYLFLHRGFPAQFKHIAEELAKNSDNEVWFITAYDKGEIKGVKKIFYTLPKRNFNCHPYLRIHEECVLHGQCVAQIAMDLKQKGIVPDIIIGFSWGPTMFIKEIYPDVPFLCYFEWINKSKNPLCDFHKKQNVHKKSEIKCSNAHTLMDLAECDAGLCPTVWQKKQFPTEYQNKIKVIHDGIDTDKCVPDKNVKIFFKDKNLTLTSNDEIITFATRALDPYRGFPEFMESVEKLLVKRPNAHFIIAGSDTVCYGPPLKEGTYKELMLKKLKLDMSRVHFLNYLNFDAYLKVLQISSVHVYLTYPFFLSWSLLEAMSAECCIVASNTEPVLEVIKDNKNGLLVDMFNIDEIVKKIEYALDNQNKMKNIRANARKTILEKYDLKLLLPKQLDYINSLIKKK